MHRTAWRVCLSGLSQSVQTRKGVNSEGDEAGWANPDRHLRLALRRVARSVLSEGAGATQGAGVCFATLRHHRDQRNVLFIAATGEFYTLGGGDAGGFRVCGEGVAVYHAHAEAARGEGSTGELLW